jgi:hypothetical protein
VGVFAANGRRIRDHYETGEDSGEDSTLFLSQVIVLQRLRMEARVGIGRLKRRFCLKNALFY